MTSTIGRSANLRPGAAGFTLLELVLVMLILSMLAALAAPSLRGFIVGRKSTDAAAQIIALAHYARTQAVDTGATYRLNVDTATQTYRLSVQKGATFYELGNEFGRAFSLPQGTTVQWATTENAAQEYFQFHSDGRIEAGVLQLTDIGGQVIELGCRSETELLTVLQRGTR